MNMTFLEYRIRQRIRKGELMKIDEDYQPTFILSEHAPIDRGQNIFAIIEKRIASA